MRRPGQGPFAAAAPLLAGLAGLALLAVPAACGHLPFERQGSARTIPCQEVAGAPPAAAAGPAPPGSAWLYQLQGLSPAAAAATSFDTVVMDYSADGSDEARYGTAGTGLLQAAGKQAVAYLSIGEAESYRYYFEPEWITPIERQPAPGAPCWLARANPEWPGNYKVQYWSEGWQQLVLGYLDRIIDDGFDGVYLDIIDAYQYWSDAENGQGYTLSRQAAAERMIDLVVRIARHARVERGRSGFLVIPQNGEDILDYDGGHSGLPANAYLDAISAVGVEDLYYNETAAQPAAETSYRQGYLDRITGAGKKILVVDYVDRGSRPPEAIVSEFRNRALADGYLPYAARRDRALDEINTFPGQP